jgi:hypothetical protein
MAKQPPSKRNRTIAHKRAAGVAVTALAAEFGLSTKRINEIATATDRYERGEAMLRQDAMSLEGLDLVGKIPSLARISLQAQGFLRLEDLKGLSLRDLLMMPNIGRRAATVLMELRAPQKTD